MPGLQNPTPGLLEATLGIQGAGGFAGIHLHIAVGFIQRYKISVNETGFSHIMITTGIKER
jgi:hypothetical protein